MWVLGCLFGVTLCFLGFWVFSLFTVSLLFSCAPHQPCISLVNPFLLPVFPSLSCSPVPPARHPVISLVCIVCFILSSLVSPALCVLFLSCYINVCCFLHLCPSSPHFMTKYILCGEITSLSLYERLKVPLCPDKDFLSAQCSANAGRCFILSGSHRESVWSISSLL